MTSDHEAVQGGEWGGRLSPGDVHDVLFTRAGLGRRGYEEVEVDVFLERVHAEITRLIAEKADLRDEVSRLKGRLAADGPREPGLLSKGEANLQAVRLLAAAQQTADTYVADAEKYSQRVTTDAREHSDEILTEARQSAQQLVAQAERLAREAADRTVSGTGAPGVQLSAEELDHQVTYLKTFSQVCRVQLRAYLEALLRDVEEEWGRADPGAVMSLPARGEIRSLAGTTGPSAHQPLEVPGQPATSQQPAGHDAPQVEEPVAEVDLTAAVSPEGSGGRRTSVSHSR
jgi:DivIVA domain-containing protein